MTPGKTSRTPYPGSSQPQAISESLARQLVQRRNVVISILQLGRQENASAASTDPGIQLEILVANQALVVESGPDENIFNIRRVWNGIHVTITPTDSKARSAHPERVLGQQGNSLGHGSIGAGFRLQGPAHHICVGALQFRNTCAEIVRRIIRMSAQNDNVFSSCLADAHVEAHGHVFFGLSRMRTWEQPTALCSTIARESSVDLPSTTRISSRSLGKSLASTLSRHLPMYLASFLMGMTTVTCMLTSGTTCSLSGLGPPMFLRP